MKNFIWMIKFFSFISILFINLTWSQNHYLGVQVGFNVNYAHNVHYSGDVIFTGYGVALHKPSIRSSLCISYNYIRNNSLVVGADLLYAGKGIKKDGFRLLDTNNMDASFQSEYIALPIKVGVNVGDRVFAHFMFGIIPSLLITSNNIYEIQGKVYTVKPIKKSIFDLGMIAEARVGYKFKNRMKLYLSIQYDYSFLWAYHDFIPEDKPDYIGIKFKNTSFATFIGFQMPLDSKKPKSKKKSEE